MMSRRTFLQTSTAAVAGLSAGLYGLPMSGGPVAQSYAGGGRGFDHSVVLEAARERAAAPFSPRPRPEPMAGIGYDLHRNIHFTPEAALWRETGSRFQVRMFHPGRYFPEAVELNTVTDRAAHPVEFSPSQYSFNGPAAAVPGMLDGVPDIGHAGFRYLYPLNDPERLDELVAFLGASYFRALGRDSHYGLSARGISVGTAGGAPEEFPAFVGFWLEQPADGADTCRLHALLDGPSLSGAYSITIHPGENTHMDIEATLIPRRTLRTVGIAPLTSMYLFGPLDPPRFHDFRPRVHDSQGLAIAFGTGERLWRPLSNPRNVAVNAYQGENIRGFGLSQRSRDFVGYQDLGARYHLRPGAWVTPYDNWGAGSVQLVELPAEDETVDNIVAFWRPDAPLEAGSETTWRYRLSWGMEPEPSAVVGLTYESRSSIGGVPGASDHGVGAKFVIELLGVPNDDRIDASHVRPNVTVSSGEVVNPVAHRNEETGGWRVFFDIRPGDARLIDIRCFLEHTDGALSETWSYQWAPGR